ncbi:MAG: hypothetical protein NVS1B13_26890 [Flavisolibacter sp.]
MKAILILFFSFSLISCNKVTSFSGIALSNSKPVSGVHIKLIALDGHILEAQTNEQGSFSIVGLAEGTYLCIAESPKSACAADVQLKEFLEKKFILQKYIPLEKALAHQKDLLSEFYNIDKNEDETIGTQIREFYFIRKQKIANKIIGALPNQILLNWDTSRDFINHKISISEVGVKGEAQLQLPL